MAIVRAGAAYRADHRVVGITARRGGFVLDTGRGVVEAGKIVLAAGLSNAVLAPMVGLAAPVRPNKGQVIALERTPRFLALPVATIRQTDEGTVLIGDSQQDRGFDESLGLDVLAAGRAYHIRHGHNAHVDKDCDLVEFTRDDDTPGINTIAV